MNWLDVFAELKQFKDRPVIEQMGEPAPMYQQIYDCLCASIESGQLPDNSRLPTNRELAELLGVDRSTVSRAYFELQKAGLIESRVGRGTIVKVTTENTKAHTEVFWSEKFSRASDSILEIANRRSSYAKSYAKDVIALTSGIPTDEFYPYQEFRKIVSKLFAEDRAEEMFGYSPQHGHPGLVQEVSRHLRQQNIDCTEDEILIVSGSQQGIDLVTNTFVNADDVVLIEEPTYVLALSTFKAGQARLISIPQDKDGLRVEALESVLSRQQAKLLYLMPNFQNPTGATLSLAKRLRLLEIARKYQLPILEDNYVGDLYYDENPLPSLKSLDKVGGTVIHQGTFSKALCPGLRLGYLVAAKAVTDRLSLAKQSRDLSTNSQGQVVMAEYLRQGSYDKHLNKLRKIYKQRRDAMLSALSCHMSKEVLWSKPLGGMFIWSKLPDGCSSRDLLPQAEKEGVVFSPGDMFFLNGDRQEYFRLSFIQSDENTIVEGIKRLSRAVKAYLEQRNGQLANSQSKWSNQATLI